MSLKGIENYMSKEDREMFEQIKKNKELSKKDRLLYVYTEEEDPTPIKEKITEILKGYRKEYYDYLVFVYSPHNFKNYVGLDTYNDNDSTQEVRINGDISRNTCFHFDGSREDYLKNINNNEETHGFYRFITNDIVEYRESDCIEYYKKLLK